MDMHGGGKMNNVLAIDASTHRTGLATMIDGVLKYDVI